MQRLIDANALRNALHVPMLMYNGELLISYELVLDIIDKQPTIDAKPVQHGEWIDYVNSHCTCTACGSEWSYFENETERFKYCPNCGAMAATTQKG